MLGTTGMGCRSLEIYVLQGSKALQRRHRQQQWLQHDRATKSMFHLWRTLLMANRKVISKGDNDCCCSFWCCSNSCVVATGTNVFWTRCNMAPLCFSCWFNQSFVTSKGKKTHWEVCRNVPFFLDILRLRRNCRESKKKHVQFIQNVHNQCMRILGIAGHVVAELCKGRCAQTLDSEDLTSRSSNCNVSTMDRACNPPQHRPCILSVSTVQARRCSDSFVTEFILWLSVQHPWWRIGDCSSTTKMSHKLNWWHWWRHIVSLDDSGGHKWCDVTIFAMETAVNIFCHLLTFDAGSLHCLFLQPIKL